ncbi:DUF1295-domain-containing protein [Aulographum hederae CBS 113979]|uniref:DUF1295-domain-containing protein n=1 Tax=Aulographum hederae CBS 113979 TaxID=1176131 RepID=A0A6G1HFN6_9PEZI|nr:DUF1295-domain-containing protein [Aulographum hederae CBS 113979]
MTLLHRFLAATAFRSPLLRTAVPTIALAYAIQAGVAVPSILARSERFYDLSGSLTYISCTALSLYLPVLRARAAGAGVGKLAAGWPSVLKSLQGKSLAEGGWWDWRQVALSVAVGIWATRLGTFLFSRITAENGTDSRFENIRTSPSKFAVAFFAQATWVSLCLLPVTLLNSLSPAAVTSPFPRALYPIPLLGLSLYAAGILLEATADRQKSQWMKEKKEKKHSEEFLTRGLWGRSRHPNYFGEISLWTGIAVAAGGVLVTGPAQAALGLGGGLAGRMGVVMACAASPGFVTFLLTKVSGIPLSENKYDERYGDRKDYQEWKQNTPMLVPKLW